MPNLRENQFDHMPIFVEVRLTLVLFVGLASGFHCCLSGRSTSTPVRSFTVLRILDMPDTLHTNVVTVVACFLLTLC